jgi:hypothetical protein
MAQAAGPGPLRVADQRLSNAATRAIHRIKKMRLSGVAIARLLSTPIRRYGA